MAVTDPSTAKRFKASSYAGTHQARVNAAIADANQYVADNPNAADLFDDSAALYTLKNTLAKAANAKAGPNGRQAIAEDDVGGLMEATNPNTTGAWCLRMMDNVRLEFSKDCHIAQPTSKLLDFVRVNGCNNFTVTTKLGSLATARSNLGTNVRHPEWSAGKVIIDLRGHVPGSGSGLSIENNRMSNLDTTTGDVSNFKYQNLFLIGSNDCAAPGYKQDTSFFTPRGAFPVKNGIWIDIDMDGCYSGFGGHQISAILRCLYANHRSHGGTVWRNESDGHFSGGRTDSYGVSEVDFIAGYEEDGNKLLTMQPNISERFVSWYVDGIYGISCLETANSGQFNGGQTTDQSFSDSFWGEIWGVTGNHSAWQEDVPCMINDTAGVYSQMTGGLPGSIWGSVKHNFGHRGGTGAGADGGGAEIPFKARGDGNKTNGARDTTIDVDSLRARWQAKRVILGSGAVTVPAAPTLTGPPTPQTAPYTLAMSGTTDKSANWEWRLTTGGVAGGWLAGGTNTALDTKNYPALATNSYVVEARCTNSAGTSPISSPFSLVVNAGGGAPSKAVVVAGPSTPTTLNSAAFSFSAVSATSLETSLDGAVFDPHTSPQSFTGLGLGTHTFRVRGVNANGTGATSDPYTWQIVNVQPVTAISAVTLTGTAIIDKPGVWAGTDTTLLAIPFPSSISVGDFCVLVVGWGSTTAITVPSGWTVMANSPVVAGTVLSMMVAQRVYTGTEGATVVVTGPNANGGSGIILAVSGTYTTNPIAGTSKSSSG